MKVYLVGGAVRDQLLQYPVRERDWVVVGATQEAMRAQGYRQVGKDFPVFLHPQTNEEYALARTERKTAPGYKGFSVHADPSVTLDQDLQRRDLTINALAMDADGSLIDPYNGLQDIQDHVLRHVSGAFSEDPVRILRTARFAARYAHLGFQVAPETRQLMQQMVEAGEVDALVPERVWQELVKALSERHPARFFEELRACGALKIIMPELDRLFGVPQPAKYHPEIDTGVHALMVLELAAQLSDSTLTRFAALTHDLGKGLTSEEILPSHHGHEERSAHLVEGLCHRLKAPNEYRELAWLTAKYHGHIHMADQLRPQTYLKVLEQCDAFRRPDRFQQMLIACEADIRGRKGFEGRPYPQAERFQLALKAASGANAREWVKQGLKGEAIKQAVHDQRLQLIKAAFAG